MGLRPLDFHVDCFLVNSHATSDINQIIIFPLGEMILEGNSPSCLAVSQRVASYHLLIPHPLPKALGLFTAFPGKLLLPDWPSTHPTTKYTLLKWGSFTLFHQKINLYFKAS